MKLLLIVDFGIGFIVMGRIDRMAKNKNLSRAGVAKQDEFYTTYDSIQSEMNYFSDGVFEGKTVFCNCDDPFESNFTRFFLRNFNYLKLKRLICTSYSGSQMTGTQLSLFDDYDEPVTGSCSYGYVLDIDNVPMANGRGVSDEDIDTLLHTSNVVKRLNGNGDFESKECVEYLKQSDIVVTNPPFSKFRLYVKQLMDYQKKFLIIGNQNAITYKEIFPLLKANQMWLGMPFPRGNAYFIIPKGYDTSRFAKGVYNPETRQVKFRNVLWFTNLDYKQRHEDLVLYKQYNADEYPMYDNYDAINVDKTADIPMDYAGIMGVPVTFINHYNPEQFEIIGLAAGNSRATGLYGTARYTPNKVDRGGCGVVNGKRKYARMLIKAKKVQYFEN